MELPFLGYVNDICNEICEVISANVNKFYPGTPRRATPSKKSLGKGTGRSPDDVWKVNAQLCVEKGHALDEYKRIRAVIDQLSREYETSKELDYFRRYGMLKGMIKRTSMHLKVKGEAGSAPSTNTDVRQAEEKRRQLERLSGLTTQEISLRNEELQEEIREYKRKVHMIRDLIETMDRRYVASKRYIVIQRYRLMKTIIKSVIHSKWIS